MPNEKTVRWSYPILEQITKQVAISYCGSLFVDHCFSEKLVEHFFSFIEKIGLHINYMLHLRVDGPNVNLKFQKLLLGLELEFQIN